MVLQAAIEGLNATIGKAIGRIENAIAISDQAQKASLALGQSLEGANRTLDGSIKGLRGDFGTRLQAGLTALNAGFQGNIKSIGKLINQQQLTGGQFKQTARSLSQLEVVLGLSRDQTSQLADTILETNKTFAVSTDKLVAALGALERNMAVLETAGLGGVVPEALVQLAGQMGPQVEKQLASVMGFLFDPSMDTQAKLAALGLGNLRERLAAGASPVDTLLNALDQAGNAVNRLAGDTSKFYTGFSVPLNLIGPVAKDFVTLQKAMNSRERTALRNQAEFFEQISVLKSEIMAPLDMVFSEKLYPATLKFVEIIKESLSPLIEKIKKKVESIFADPEQAFDDFVDYADMIQDQLVKALNKLITGVNFFTEAAIRFVEFIDGIPFVDAAPRQMRDDAARIKELEKSIIGERRVMNRDFQGVVPVYGVAPEDQKEYNALKKAIAEGYDRFVEAARIPQIKRDEERFRNIKDRLDQERNTALGRIADATEGTESNTNKDNVQDTYIMDTSIRTLGEALMAITRQAVDGPDEYRDTVAASLSMIADNTDQRFGTPKRTGMGIPYRR